MTEMYKFSCGCSWPIIGKQQNTKALPLLDIDINKLPFCEAAWQLFSRGETKGIFQLESDLGKQWSKKLRPKSAEHLSAIGALIRPGCLQAVDDDGVSMTAHYCKRANFEEPVASYHPVVDEVLKSTYGSLVFQEQAMELSRVIAGFSLQEADMLRKAMGKKLASEMAKCKKMFIDGAKKTQVVTEDQAEEIFGWIEQSQRYSFNKSHSCCYGLTGYDTAYLKSHFPVQFFTSWLFYAKDKADSLKEISELIEDAKNFGINVYPPDTFRLNANFDTDGVDIWFGITDIKGIGKSHFEKLKISIEKHRNEIDTWESFLVKCSDEIPNTTIEKLITVGGFKKYNLNRQKMLADLKAWSSITDKEKGWILANIQVTNIGEALIVAGKTKKDGGACSSAKRAEIVKDLGNTLIHPPYPLIDIPNWIIFSETEHLGLPLTCSAIDSCDTSQINATCREYINGKNGLVILGVEVRRVKEVVTKAGKSPGSKMAFLSVSDSTGKIDEVICFPDAYKECGSLLKEGNTVLIHGERDRKGHSLLVKKAYQI